MASCLTFKQQPHKMVHIQAILRQQSTSCLSVFDHFMVLTFKELITLKANGV